MFRWSFHHSFISLSNWMKMARNEIVFVFFFFFSKRTKREKIKLKKANPQAITKGIKCDRHWAMSIRHKTFKVILHLYTLYSIITCLMTIGYACTVLLFHREMMNIWNLNYYSNWKENKTKSFTPNSWSVMLNHFVSFPFVFSLVFGALKQTT